MLFSFLCFWMFYLYWNLMRWLLLWVWDRCCFILSAIHQNALIYVFQVQNLSVDFWHIPIFILQIAHFGRVYPRCGQTLRYRHGRLMFLFKVHHHTRTLPPSLVVLFENQILRYVRLTLVFAVRTPEGQLMAIGVWLRLILKIGILKHAKCKIVIFWMLAW